MKLWLLLAVFLAASWLQAASTYYVGKDGDDSHSGTVDNAGGRWLTIQKAMNTVAAGDQVFVRPGYYAEHPSAVTSGTPGSPITFTGGWDSSITNASVTNWGFQLGDCSSSIQKNYYIIEGFRAWNTNTYNGGDKQGHSGFYLSSIGSIIRSNNFDGNAQSGLFVDSLAAHTISQSIQIYGNSGFSNGWLGMYLAGSNITAYWNTFGRSILSNSMATGGYHLPDADAVYVFGWNNTLRSNNIFGAYYADPQNGGPTFPLWGCHCDAIQTFGLDSGAAGVMTTTNLLIEDNYIENIPGNGAGFYGEEFYQVLIRNNVFVTHTGISGNTGWSNLMAFNNTLIGQTNQNGAPNPTGIGFSNGKNFTNQNNILFNFPAQQIVFTSVTGVTSDHNLEYRDDGVALSTDSSYNAFIGNDYWGTNANLIAPYASPANYQLKPISFAVDNGRNQSGVVTNDYNGLVRPIGSGWDIGAYELLQGTSIAFGTAAIGQ